MKNDSLPELIQAIEKSWSQETMYATTEPARKPSDLSRGQCGTTALVLHDHLGGEIMAAEVFRDGVQVGHHYWNRLHDGTKLDLTRGQFLPNESLGAPRVASRPADLSDHPGYPAYRALAERVRRHLTQA